MELRHGETTLELVAGQFAMLPASLGRTALTATTPIEFLHIQNR
jgi:hypothetical protein